MLVSGQLGVLGRNAVVNVLGENSTGLGYCLWDQMEWLHKMEKMIFVQAIM